MNIGGTGFEVMKKSRRAGVFWHFVE
jgi:hypothetical protein